MGLNFGKIDFSTSFDRTSAFPLDAKSYFEKLSDAIAAAQSAKIAGSTETCYYFGQTVAVVDTDNGNLTELYLIIPAAGGQSGTLKKLAGEEACFYVGYYAVLQNEFYEDSTYTKALPHNNTKLYIDLNNAGTYRYMGDGVGFKLTHFEPQASAEVAGIMKLYQTPGQDPYGTMSQQAVTNGVKEIQFTADGDCLILNLP